MYFRILGYTSPCLPVLLLYEGCCKQIMSMEELNSQRLVYLITYSRADESIVASRESIARVVVDAWNTVTESSILQWVVTGAHHPWPPSPL